MTSIEFYTFDREMWYRHQGRNEQLTEDSREMVSFVHNRIRDYYKEAYKKLHEHYGKRGFTPKLLQYRIVKRFCHCNFGEIHQSVFDVDSKGRFRFERVACPLYGECDMEGIVCNPKFTSQISDSEMRVLELVFRGCEKEAIANQLCLSLHTVNNHIRNAYTRLGFHEKAEFIDYAHVHKLFKEE